MASLHTSLWLCLLAASTIPPPHNHGHQPIASVPDSKTGPAWSSDLRTLGFTGFEPRGDQRGVLFRERRLSLCFIDDNTLVATFITRDQNLTLLSREQPGD